MSKHQNQNFSFTSSLLTIILAVACLAAILWLIISVDRAYRLGNLLSRTSRQELRKPNPDNIQSWMTFDYINRIFKLPPEYLKTQLTITDRKYPNIEIKNYAKSQNEDVNTIIENLKQSIKNYKGN